MAWASIDLRGRLAGLHALPIPQAVTQPFGVICLLLGVAFAVSTLSIIAHPSYGDDGLTPTLGVVATAFLLGSFALLRQRQKTPPRAAIVSNDCK
jgi:hypothetical protein